MLKFIAVLLAAALTAIGAGGASAQAPYPNRPIRVVVPFGPGGFADITMRLVGQKLSERTGQQVVIENRPSAGLIVGTEYVAHSPSDGYTLLSTMTAHVQTPFLFTDLPFDTVRDFQPITDMRASSDYRLDTAKSLLYRFWLETRAQNPLDKSKLDVRAIELVEAK